MKKIVAQTRQYIGGPIGRESEWKSNEKGLSLLDILCIYPSLFATDNNLMII